MQLLDRIVAPLRRPAGGAGSSVAAAAPALATLVLVILIAAQLASLLWRVLGSGETDAPLMPAADVAAVPVVDLAAIVNAHLFGVASLQGDLLAAPATAANLTLAGTLAGQAPESGWAIIGASGQSARVYATGASLPGGAKLLAVYPDRVILDRNGARESLMLPRLSGALAAGYPPPSIAAEVTSADSVRQLFSQNPGVANELIRPQPVFAGGTLRGYRVYPGRDRAQFSRLGLQPGDLVSAVNGVALDDPGRALEILNGVGVGSAVTLTIDRNGQVQQLSIDPAPVVQELLATEDAQSLNRQEATE